MAGHQHQLLKLQQLLDVLFSEERMGRSERKNESTDLNEQRVLVCYLCLADERSRFGRTENKVGGKTLLLCNERENKGKMRVFMQGGNCES